MGARAYILLEVEDICSKEGHAPEFKWDLVAKDLGYGWDKDTRIRMLKAWDANNGDLIISDPIEVKPFRGIT